MPRPKTDSDAENLLIDQEAEKQDTQARLKAGAESRFRAGARKVLARLKQPRPDPKLVADMITFLATMLLRELAYAGNDLRKLIVRQRDERKAAFGKRSKYKLSVEPISKASLEKRAKEKQAAVAASRVDNAGT